MDNLINYLSAHPLALIILVAVAFLLIYFIFKGLLKLILITGLVLIALSGYYYYKAPDEFPGNLREMAGRVGDHGEGMIEAGKNMIEKGKDLADKVGESVKKKENATAD
ncbi:MAG: hypothetical protein U9N37_04055 [Thermodesulfobacteriota bacterium]|nr:hypothetical protein [Thermodesulfobacteriota bacterium]